MSVTIFFCYAHEDEPFLNKLKAYLRPLQRQGLIDIWHDRDISAGTEWEREISQHLNEAKIILLLVSPDFMNSDYCYSIEMKRALERHDQKDALVIPVILRPIYWQGMLGKLQALPTDAKPIVDRYWHSLDEALYDVAEGIRKVVENLPGQVRNFREQRNQSAEGRTPTVSESNGSAEVVLQPPKYVEGLFGNYRLTRLLGAGGFAEVYLGQHLHSGVQAAVKVMVRLLTGEDVEEFLQQARNMALLIHPHIVRVLDFGVEKDIPFIAMDYASNGTLRDRYPKGTQIPLATITQYVHQIADALQYAHQRRFIHGDLKPENLLLVGQLPSVAAM